MSLARKNHVDYDIDEIINLQEQFQKEYEEFINNNLVQGNSDCNHLFNTALWLDVMYHSPIYGDDVCIDECEFCGARWARLGLPMEKHNIFAESHWIPNINK